MKRKKLLLTLLGVLLALPALARDFTCTYEGQTLTYTVIDEEAKTCKTKDGVEYTSSFRSGNYVSGTLIIPSVAKDGDVEYTVTALGNVAFGGELTSVTIPESVTTIGKYAFWNCDKLTSAEFASIEALCGIDFATVWSNPLYVAHHLYIAGKEVTEVVIPNTVSKIGDYAFSGCSSLTSAEFASIEALCGIDFANNGSNPLSMAHHLYIAGKEVTEVVIPDAVSEIGKYTFSGCSSLTSVSIPEKVTSIGSSAFDGCSSLTSVTIPEKVTSIGSEAFRGCSSLTSVSIPEKVTSIGSSAFDGCSSLTSVTIPEKVTSIGSEAFRGCSSLASVKLMRTEPMPLESNVFDENTYKNAALDIPKNTLVPYLASEWNKFENISVGGYASKIFSDGVFTYRLIEDPDNREAVLVAGDYSSLTEAAIPERFTDDSDAANPVRYYITAIGPKAFENCSSLATVSINSRSIITAIAASAFQGCKALTSFAMPSGLVSIGNSAFLGSGLEQVTFNESLTSIEAKAFSGTKLKDVTVNEQLTSLGRSAFADCQSLASVTLNNALKEIADSTFANCPALASVSFGSGLETIGSRAFTNSGITSAVFNDRLAVINSSAFEDCHSLASVSFGSGLETIGNRAFANSGLISVKFNEGLTKIGEEAFRYCSNLRDVTISSTVTEIGRTAFAQCDDMQKAEFASIESLCGIKFENLNANPLSKSHKLYIDGTEVTKVVIPESVTEIGDYAFGDFTNLTEVTIPESVMEIGDYAFAGCVNLDEIVIPNSVKSLGSYSFSGCEKLNEVTIGNSVESIGSTVFYGCDSIRTLTIADAVTPIQIAEADWWAGTDWLVGITKLYMGRNIVRVKN